MIKKSMTAAVFAVVGVLLTAEEWKSIPEMLFVTAGFWVMSLLLLLGTEGEEEENV